MPRTPATEIRLSPLLIRAATTDAQAVLSELGTSIQGLSDDEAQRRLEEHGPNQIVQGPRITWLNRLVDAVRNPLVVLLSGLAVVSLLTGDIEGTIIIIAMVAIGVGVRFVQEMRADASAEKLKAMVSVTATVVRQGQRREIPLAEVVPGDIVQLSAGDMIPADVRLLSTKDLFVNRSSLTGESFPVEQFDTPPARPPQSILDLVNIGFMGTNVQSGSATAVVLVTGSKTYFGAMARTITTRPVETSFDRGVNRFAWLMIKFMLVMVPLVFLINGLTKGDWIQAFFFALAVAVGLTPEMLPMIVMVCLSKGAIVMSRQKVIVKRLSAIQNLGAMDVLCTDKTGTLTLDRVILEQYCDVVRHEDDEVLRLSYLNSFYQTGLKNVLDKAILAHKELDVSGYAKVDEIPFDFQRKMMSVVVRRPDGVHRLITKGSPDELLARCSHFELEGQVYEMEDLVIEDLKDEYMDLGNDGFRVLAVAYKDMPHGKQVYSKDDEHDLVLRGYLAFLDPPKETSAKAIAALRRYGVAVKVLTGDNELVTRKIGREVGLDIADVVLGSQVEAMTDDQLGEAALRQSAFARLSPTHKERIVRVLRDRGRVVGFLGDGINDAPALRAADVGISVDTAVDIAKESADIILLEKSLLVLGQGVLEGRRVFANIIKYIKMGASSSFGNMFSVVGASAFLPFLPMLPVQVLTLTLLYDFSQIPIPTDNVDEEFLLRPRQWGIEGIRRFILFIGPISSIFDYTTYFMMLYIFGAWNNPELFRTGWFVESLFTQTLIIHVIRTNKIPFLQSQPSTAMLATTIAVVAFGAWLPFSPLGPYWDFTPLPRLYWPLLAGTLLAYVALTQTVKVWLTRRAWI